MSGVFSQVKVTSTNFKGSLKNIGEKEIAEICRRTQGKNTTIMFWKKLYVQTRYSRKRFWLCNMVL